MVGAMPAHHPLDLHAYLALCVQPTWTTINGRHGWCKDYSKWNILQLGMCNFLLAVLVCSTTPFLPACVCVCVCVCVSLCLPPHSPGLTAQHLVPKSSWTWPLTSAPVISSVIYGCCLSNQSSMVDLWPHLWLLFISSVIYGCCCLSHQSSNVVVYLISHLWLLCCWPSLWINPSL